MALKHQMSLVQNWPRWSGLTLVVDGNVLLARDTTEQGDKPRVPAGSHRWPLAMRHRMGSYRFHVGWPNQLIHKYCVFGYQTSRCSWRATIFSRKEHAPENNIPPSFIALRICVCFTSPLCQFCECAPSRTRSILLLLRSKHSASGRRIWAQVRHQTVCHWVTGTSLQRLRRMGQSTHIEMKDKICSQKVRGTFQKVQRPCHSQDYSSGGDVGLGKGAWHFCVYKVRLQVSLSFHVDYASTCARVSERLEDQARLLGNLQDMWTHGKAFNLVPKLRRSIRVVTDERAKNSFTLLDPVTWLLRN